MQLDIREKRLVILYILKTLNTLIASDKLEEIIVTTTPIKWFDAQIIIKSLKDDGLIRQENNFYDITNQGLTVIENYASHLFESMRLDIKNYIDKNWEKLTGDTIIIANYRRNYNSFQVHLELKEMGEDLIDLTIMVPSKEIAEKICENFKINTVKIYRNILDMIV